MEHIIDKIKSLAIENFEEIRECRRHLHRHPELSFEEKAANAADYYIRITISSL